MRTTTERPVRSFTTRTCVPNGRVRWAAVRALALKVSPLAVLRPWKPGPYQEARPLWSTRPDRFSGSAMTEAGVSTLAPKVDRPAIRSVTLRCSTMHSLVVVQGRARCAPMGREYDLL